jgi:lipoprotein-releasing system permease protein
MLCLRYLRSRYIALASIISVTLGVATMIVVNSVMSGFQSEMYKRLHGILSDVVVEAQSMEGIQDPQILEREIRDVLGDDLEGMTSTVHIPAMLSFQYRGEWVTRQINLIGIDQETYAKVSDFSKYLLHPENRARIGFDLRESGYDERMQEAGWTWRRLRAAQDRFYREQQQRLAMHEARVREAQRAEAAESSQQAPDAGVPVADAAVADAAGEANERQSPATEVAQETPATEVAQETPATEVAQETPATEVTLGETPGPGALEDDPFAQLANEEPQGAEFDPATQQHVGIVLGIATCSIRHRTQDGRVMDVFLCKPGDDVKVTFPTAGTPPQLMSGHFTVVDAYESKMSEYDSSFAFIPIERLQYLRGMVNPATGMASVSSVQIKLRPGADLNAACQKLRVRFPAELFPYRIETWKDLQGPLLAAVQMETTILNILLFLIIAVAGFGILATFFMIVVEKTRDIGVLKSLGATRQGVMSIFLGYGLSLGIVGSGVGMVLGLLFVTNINQIADQLERLTGREVFDPTVYYFQEIPTIISPPTIAWISAGAMMIAILASVLPALRAARMHPVEALRYE